MLAVVFWFVLFFWSGAMLASYDDAERMTGVVIRFVLVATTVLLVAGVFVSTVYGLFIEARRRKIVYLQNDQPVDMESVMWSPRLVERMLENHYKTDQLWAQNSGRRGMNGSWSPTYNVTMTGPVGGVPEVPMPDPELETAVALSELSGPPGHIIYGRTATGVLTVDYRRTGHGLRQGDTGSGKTTALNTEIVQHHRLIKAGVPIQLRGGDLKGEFAATWGRSQAFEGGILETPEEILDMLEDCVEIVRQRNTKFKQAAADRGTVITDWQKYAAKTGEQLPMIVVYLDEMNVLLGDTIQKKTRDKIVATTKRLLQTARSAGVVVNGNAQYMTAALFDREGSKQFTTRTYFGQYDTVALGMIFTGKIPEPQEIAPMLTGDPGRGIMAGAGLRPTIFQSAYVTDEEIVQEVEDSLLGGLLVRSTGNGKGVAV